MPWWQVLGVACKWQVDHSRGGDTCDVCKQQKAMLVHAVVLLKYFKIWIFQYLIFLTPSPTTLIKRTSLVHEVARGSCGSSLRMTRLTSYRHLPWLVKLTWTLNNHCIRCCGWLCLLIKCIVSVLCDGTFEGSCYHVEAALKNWAQARDRCVDWGGHLAIITSQAENQYVSDLVQGE